VRSFPIRKQKEVPSRDGLEIDFFAENKYTFQKGPNAMIKKIAVRDIKPNPFQARTVYDREAINTLADEIKSEGLWAGALRGRSRNGRVELCFGHRRLEAIKQLGWKDVEVDIVELSDDEMATQSLIENLQREGLNDLDKAEGISALVKQLRRSKGYDENRAIRQVSAKLGLSPAWIRELIGITAFDAPAKDVIRKGKIKGRTAMEAHRIGGSRMVQTAALKGLPVHKLTKIGTKLSEIEDKQIRQKLKQEVLEGKLTEPEDIERKARVIIARRQKDAPADLNLIIIQWTRFIDDWNKKLDDVLPHKDYIDRVPKVAAGFRASIRALIQRLEKFL
jgi:ParB/RepB/Spo0J family partition protein